MGRRAFGGLLAVEAVVCVALCFLNRSVAGVFPAAMAFPFEQIGMGLRALSLSGGAGNAAATAMYILVSLIPAGLLLLFRKRRALCAEDWLLGLLGAALFGVLYLMVNPGLITELLGMAAQPPVGKAILGGAVYSLIAGYLVLRALRLFTAGNTKKLERYMTLMLGGLNVLFVLLAFGVCFGDMLASLSSLRAGNSGNGRLLGASYVFLLLRYAVNALPYVLDIFVVFAALGLLDETRRARYSGGAVAAAGRMSRLCAAALTATTLTSLVYNLLQLLFARSLLVISSTVEIPVMSLLFVLAALLLTRFVMENKRLKDENDGFI